MPEQETQITVTVKTTVEDHRPRFVSKSVSSIIIVIGIIAELFALILITIENKGKLVFAPDFTLLNMIALIALIASLFIHHYFIMINFKKIDATDDVELKKMGFGDWVCKRNFEDYLRIPIFLLFAVLTGEIPYIFAVGMKIFAHINHTDEVFNLEWLTKIFISASFGLALLMLIWNIVGLIYDKRNPFSKRTGDNEDTPINSFPFNSVVSAFLWSDIFAFLVWTCFLLMFVFGQWYFNDLLKYFSAFYTVIILLRAWGEGSRIIKKNKKTA